MLSSDVSNDAIKTANVTSVYVTPDTCWSLMMSVSLNKQSRPKI